MKCPICKEKADGHRHEIDSSGVLIFETRQTVFRAELPRYDAYAEIPVQFFFWQERGWNGRLQCTTIPHWEPVGAEAYSNYPGLGRLKAHAKTLMRQVEELREKNAKAVKEFDAMTYWRSHLHPFTVRKLDAAGYSCLLDAVAVGVEWDRSYAPDKYTYFSWLLKKGVDLGVLDGQTHGEIHDCLARWEM